MAEAWLQFELFWQLPEWKKWRQKLVGELPPRKRLPEKLRLRRVDSFQEGATILCLQSLDFDGIFDTFRRLTTSLLRSRLAILHRTQKELPIFLA